MKKLAFILILLIPQIGFSQIINVPGDYPTIQAGIDAASNGDTVLVDTGTYVENISLSEKHITIGSKFLSTLDTNYISQTIIDGNREDAVVKIKDSADVVLSGFTITNGLSGIYCYSYSKPLLRDLRVINNKNDFGKGGIYLGSYSAARLENIHIAGNLAYDPNSLNPGAGEFVGYGRGGGIFCAKYSMPELKNVMIKNNISDGIFGGLGGGMYLSAPCAPVMENVTITGNYAAGTGSGGGICSHYTWYGNQDMMPHQVQTSLFGNNNRENSELIPIFDSVNRCNIYFNKAALGNDLYFGHNDTVKIVLDTFTVLLPTGFHAIPKNILLFDIKYGKLEQAVADLYVSPDGDNNNSGLSPDQPLETIYRANLKIISDSLNPRKINLKDGHYSPSATGEFFPVNLPDYVDLTGESENGTVLNAEDTTGVLFLIDNQSNRISDLTIKGGCTSYGGGFYCYNSTPILENLSITNNLTNISLNGGRGFGGGLYSYGGSPLLKNVSIHNNQSGLGGGVFIAGEVIFDSIERCDIHSNTAIQGNDIYVSFSDPPIPVIVDTFTVMYPTEFHATDLSSLTFDILHSKYEQRDADLYISSDGNNSNSGLTVDDPLKTIHFAQTVILPDSNNLHTFYIADGIYSPSQTGEFFPVNLLDFLKISGTAPQEVIIDAEHTSRSNLIIENNLNNHISGVTLSGAGGEGWWSSDAGIKCLGSHPGFKNIQVSNNEATGIYLQFSDAQISNVIVENNNTGIYCSGNSNPFLENVSVKQNNWDGIIAYDHSSPVLNNVLIADNGSNGITIYDHSNPILRNTTITGHSGTGMDISRFSDHPLIINTLIWGNTKEVVIDCNFLTSSSVTLSYSNIRGGEDGIVNDSSCTINWLEGNIDEDPIFVGSGNHPYQINDYSPCIDAGTPDTTGLSLPEYDLAGQERIFNNRVDIGAYEWNAFVGNNEVQSSKSYVACYPNPFSTLTTIEYELNHSETVQIIIYNHLGKQLEVIQQNQSSGKQQVVWNAEGLPGGVYFCVLKTNPARAGQTIKMIKLK